MHKRMTRVLEIETPKGTVLLAIRMGGQKEPTVLAAGRRRAGIPKFKWSRDQESVGALMAIVPRRAEGTGWAISHEPAPEIGPSAPWKLEPLMQRLGINESLLDPKATPEPSLDDFEDLAADDSGAPIELPEDSIVDLPLVDLDDDEDEEEPEVAETETVGLKPKAGIYEWRGSRPGGAIGKIACFVILDRDQNIKAAAQAAVGRNQGESDGPSSALPWKTKRSEMVKALRVAPPFQPQESGWGGWSETRKDVPNLQSMGRGVTPASLWEEES